jgi:hypothetical protein
MKEMRLAKRAFGNLPKYSYRWSLLKQVFEKYYLMLWAHMNTVINHVVL